MKKIKSFFGYFLFSSGILLLANAIFLFENHNLPDGRILFMLPVTSAFVLSYMVCIGLMSKRFLDNEKSCWMAGYVTVLSIFFLFFAHPIYVIFQFVHFLPEVLLKMPYVGVFPFSDYFLIFGIGTIVYSLILMKLNGWMERRLSIALCGLGAFLVSSVILVGGAYFYSFNKRDFRQAIPSAASPQFSIPAEREVDDLETYTNDRLRFSLDIPKELVTIKESWELVDFRESPDGPWVFNIYVQETSSTSVDAWLDTQSRGDVAKEGLGQVISRIETSQGVVSVVERRIITDYDAGKPLYGKLLMAFFIQDGLLYRMDFRNEAFGANEISQLNPRWQRALASFKFLPKTLTPSSPSIARPIQVAPYNELLSNVGEQTIRNTQYDFTFKIPVDWSVSGLLGESKILSPEDRRINEEWDRANQDVIWNTEGDAPMGPDERSLYISCQYGLEAYINSPSDTPSTKKKTLAEVFASDDRMKDLGRSLVKTMQIQGKTAYEISSTTKTRTGISMTRYVILIEADKGCEVHLDSVEYDKLSKDVQQIIQSISFEN